MIRGLACGALLACASPLAAQDASLAFGGSHVRYADSLDGTAGFLGARLGLGRDARAAQLDAGLSRFTDGGWAVQLSAQGTSLWSVGGGPGLVGFAVGAAVNDIEGGTASGTGAVGPMFAFRSSCMQVVAGASAGAYRTIEGAWSGIASGSLRWYWVPHRQVAVDLGGTGIGADTLRFADLSAHVRLETGPVQVGMLGGARAGDLSDGPWGWIEAALDVGRRVKLEASAGRYPPDVTGFVDGAYAQLGVRVFALRSPRAARLPLLPVEIRRLDDGRVRVTLRYRTPATRLEIAGDWNGWTPVALTAGEDGRWWADLEIRPGTYGFALLGDGGWVVPDGVPGADDGFGGRVATLVVPR